MVDICRPEMVGRSAGRAGLAEEASSETEIRFHPGGEIQLKVDLG
jgi:hypothetical protein